jgi:hypothetical protein
MLPHARAIDPEALRLITAFENEIERALSERVDALSRTVLPLSAQTRTGGRPQLCLPLPRGVTR